MFDFAIRRYFLDWRCASPSSSVYGNKVPTFFLLFSLFHHHRHHHHRGSSIDRTTDGRDGSAYSNYTTHRFVDGRATTRMRNQYRDIGQARGGSLSPSKICEKTSVESRNRQDEETRVFNLQRKSFNFRKPHDVPMFYNRGGVMRCLGVA